MGESKGIYHVADPTDDDMIWTTLSGIKAYGTDDSSGDTVGILVEMTDGGGSGMIQQGPFRSTECTLRKCSFVYWVQRAQRCDTRLQAALFFLFYPPNTGDGHRVLRSTCIH